MSQPDPEAPGSIQHRQECCGLPGTLSEASPEERKNTFCFAISSSVIILVYFHGA